MCASVPILVNPRSCAETGPVTLLIASPRPTCPFVLTVLLVQMCKLSSTAVVRTAFPRTKTVANNNAHSVGMKWHAVISPKFQHVICSAHGLEGKQLTVVPPHAWNIFDPQAREDYESGFDMLAESATSSKVLLVPYLAFVLFFTARAFPNVSWH